MLTALSDLKFKFKAAMPIECTVVSARPRKDERGQLCGSWKRPLVENDVTDQ